MSRRQVLSLVKGHRTQICSKGERVVLQGSRPTYVYIVYEGEFETYRTRKMVENEDVAENLLKQAGTCRAARDEGDPKIGQEEDGLALGS